MTDRANVVTRAVLQVVAERLARLIETDHALSSEIAAYLRDEFADVAQQTASEIRRDDE